MVFPRLFGREFDIPAGAPAPISDNSVQNLERILEASKRVEESLGIRVDNDKASKTLVTVKNQRVLVTALRQHQIGILDFAVVREHQKKRVRRTLGERFLQGASRIADTLDNCLMHGWSGIISAWTALLVTIPFGIPFLIDRLWYDVLFLDSYFAVLLPQIVVLGVGALFSEQGRGFSWWLDDCGRFYASVHKYLIGWPVAVITTLVAAWFLPGTSGRHWKTFSVKGLFEKTGMQVETALVIDKVQRAVPDARLEFEALMNADGTRDGEVFLAIDVGDLEDDELHVWHGRM